MVLRIEYFHSKNFIHRDIKPENIMVGQGKKANTIFLVDFGLAKRYLCPRWGSHIPFKQDRCLIGTERFLSLSGHQCNEQSRRDDLEALGIVLVYFLRKGHLPWDIEKPKLPKPEKTDINYEHQIDERDRLESEW